MLKQGWQAINMVEYRLCYKHNEAGQARYSNIFRSIVCTQFLRYANFLHMCNNTLVDKSYAKFKILVQLLLKM